MTTGVRRRRTARAGAWKAPARWMVLAVLSVVVAACGGGSAVTTASPSPEIASSSPGPKATPWPVDVIDSVLALGAADAELWKAGADIAKAADAKDVEAMWGAADGTVKLIDGLMPNVEALEGYPHTADLGARYRASFTKMRTGAAQLRDSITAGDPAGVVAGSKVLAEGVTLYGDVRKDIEAFVNEALAMKKNLLN